MYYNGPNNQSSVKANVKVRVWKASSLPDPDFTRLGTYMDARGSEGKCLVHCT